jgi:hypothetical protein
MKDLKHLRANLKAALPEILAIGAIKSWRIDAQDKVHIERV